MKKFGSRVLIVFIIIIALFFIVKFIKKADTNPEYEIGEAIDSLNGVIVYYNGGVDNVEGRNVTDDYNVGLRYQCVEFVKRYYFEHYQHKMPESYGHAKSFFDNSLADGELNEQRALTQFTNPSVSKPKIGDLLVMDGMVFNRFGHVAIISDVSKNRIEVIQQNPGPHAPSRKKLKLIQTETDHWKIEYSNVLGWLRKE